MRRGAVVHLGAGRVHLGAEEDQERVGGERRAAAAAVPPPVWERAGASMGTLWTACQRVEAATRPAVKTASHLCHVVSPPTSTPESGTVIPKERHGTSP